MPLDNMVWYTSFQVGIHTNTNITNITSFPGEDISFMRISFLLHIIRQKPESIRSRHKSVTIKIMLTVVTGEDISFMRQCFLLHIITITQANIFASIWTTPMAGSATLQWI